MFLLLFLLAGLAWRKTKRWNRERQERPIPYRVVKPPSEVITERAQGEGKKKRIVACCARRDRVRWVSRGGGTLVARGLSRLLAGAENRKRE